VPRVVEPARHRSAPRRPVALIAGVATVVVALGAGALVSLTRDGGAPAPEALDRPATTAAPTTPPAAPSSTARVAQPAPVAAGGLRAAPRTTPAATSTPTAPTSRQQRPDPGAPGTAPKAGKATFYTLAGLPNCGYADAAASGTYVALGPAEWGDSAACGTVLDVTGPKGTVRVTVSDQCPECEAGHLDLAAPAFARIADPVAGVVPITYTRVVDPPAPGPVRIRVKEGSSQYWLALLPIDTGNPLAAVTVDGHPLQRTGYGYWVADKGAGPGPYVVRLTDDRGHSATAQLPLSVAATVTTGIRLY
jgi:hypothetical protein